VAMARQNAVFLTVALAGVVLSARRCWRNRGRDTGETTAVIAVAAYTIAALFYPHAWPYFLATLVPGLALFWGSAIGEVHRLLERGESHSLTAVSVAILFAVGLALPAERVRQNMALDNDYQIAVIDRLHQVLGPEDSYFDGTGMAPTLERSSMIWLDVISLTTFRKHPEAVEPLVEQLAGAHIGAIVLNERVEALPPSFQRFRNTFFVQDWGSVFVPGTEVDTSVRPGMEVSFQVLTPGNFHVRGGEDAWRRLRIDGKPLTTPVVRLDVGDHRVVADADVGKVRLLRLPPDFEEDRAPLDAYKPLFPKERFILGH